MVESRRTRIDLVWLGRHEVPAWSLGAVHPTAPTPRAVSEGVWQEAPDAWLFWDSSLGKPDEAYLLSVIDRPGDLWHAGLRLGMAGQPGLIDFVQPTWMLNRDPDPELEATSWRVSLRACLVRADVLRQLGGADPSFQTLEGAALEMGHRYITRGVLMRHLPELVPNHVPSAKPELSLEDELRFIYYRFGRRWSGWALMRALLSGYATRSILLQAWKQVTAAPRPAVPEPFQREMSTSAPVEQKARVSVLIPTLERYPYLRTLLDQLRRQTVKPLEIIVVDQTPADRRDVSLAGDFADLPLQILWREQAGQCSARNAGVQQAKGDYILLSDDDIEVSPALIEEHLRTLASFEADTSSGVADEVGAGPLPEHFTYVRASDVFPAGITLVRRTVFEQTGLFDLAYDQGQRADGDLGMRVYLMGYLMVLNPDICVFHHRAPRGGLRAHKARVITYASSRSRIAHRHLPSVWDIYLTKRYFTDRQVREMLWLRILGTFSIRGSKFKKTLKVITSLLALPDTLWQVRKRYWKACAMLQEYPQISSLKVDDHHPKETYVH